MLSVALIGPAGAGKSTLATYLERWYGYVRLSFAEPLRALAEAAFGPIEKDGRYAVRPGGGPEEWWTGRELLQRIGTDALRDQVDEDFWVRIMRRRLDAMGAERPGVPVVVDDCRYPNEHALLSDRGFLVVRVLGRGQSPNDHASERYWRTMPRHLDVDNSVPVDIAGGLLGRWAARERPGLLTEDGA